MTHAHGSATKPTADERHGQLTEQTAKWVSQTFFGQMLKQMRDSPFKSKLFDGGRGGEAFQQMADQRLADSMARGTGHKLVDSIVDRIEHKGQGAPIPEPAAVKPDVAKLNIAKPTFTRHDWGQA